MHKKPTYRVATAGLDERDVRLIEIVFRHSQYNAVSYALVPVSTDGLVDILIINPFQPDGLRTLSRIRARGQSTPLITAVPVGMQSPARHVIHIERLALQLLPVLNQLVESDFGAPAPQVFRMTDSRGRRVDRSALGERIGKAGVRVSASRDAGDSVAVPSTLSAETAVASTMGADSVAPDSAFAGSTVVTATLTADSAFGPTVRAVPMPPVSILSHSSFSGPAAPGHSPDKPDAPDKRDGVSAAAGNSRDAEVLPNDDAVLIVDDSPTVRRQMTQALSRMGLTCVAVAGGKEALEMLNKRPFVMALVDVVMGDMDGYQLTREIRRQAPHVPVVILTSRSSPFDLARGALSGCSSYLVKPVPIRRLQSVVERRLTRQRKSQDSRRNSADQQSDRKPGGLSQQPHSGI